jgi:predicted small metal-binding protein
MAKRIAVVLLALVLSLALQSPLSAQDMKAEPMKAGMKEAGPVKEIVCDPACGFVVRSRDEKELISVAKQHMKTHHKMNPTDKDLKAKIKVVE